MIFHFSSDELHEKKFGASVKGLKDTQGNRPWAVVLPEQEVLKMIRETDPEKVEEHVAYLQHLKESLNNKPKEITITIA